MTADGAKTGVGLKSLLRPRSVCVVGASDSRESVGGAVFSNLIKGGFKGPVYPVNARRSHVQSVHAYRRLRDLPEVPELVVVAVPAPRVIEVVREAAQLGVKGAVVLSAGFREVGAPGRVMEAELVAVARDAGMRLLGPNCLGLQNPDPEVRLDATFATTFAPDGGVAFASQSGALGLAALDYARELGLGFSFFASLGNKADVSGNDLLEHIDSDGRTRVVLLYLESLGNAHRFREIAARVGRKTPIALVKSGRSGAGVRAAGSHTGALAGPDAAISALCAQTGVVRADTLEQLFDVAMVLANQPLPKGRRVAVVTNAGGPGILAADALEAAGLVVPSLAPATEAALRQVLRPEASVGNPVDVLADSEPAVYRSALKAVLDDKGIDAVLALYVPPITREAEQMAGAIVEAAAGTDKPILSCFLGSHGVPAALASLHARKIPSFRFPEGAAKALALAVSYAEWRAAPVDAPEVELQAPAAALEVLASARARLGAQAGWLEATEVAAFAEAWGLPLAPYRHVAPTLEAAEEAAKALGYPVVLKAEVEGLVHKTEAGAVALHLDSGAAVREAASRMLELSPRRFLVQKEVEGGEEWLVGAIRDPSYGPLVTVGAGGTRAELWRDVHQRLAPLSATDVEALVSIPKVGRTLQPWRGRPAGDKDALTKLVRRLAAVASAHPELSELEINPVRVHPKGQGVVALDLRVHLGPAGASR